MTETKSAMLDALQAIRPNAAQAAKLALYGQFVGSWQLDAEFSYLSGAKRRVEGEWHFDWVLDGKAIQDVWMVPSRRLREGATETPTEPWYYGSTMRWYDPTIDAWHIAWFDPSRPLELRQIGRAAGADIVQVGQDPTGVMTRWRFVDIAASSFRWLGEMSWDRGGAWTQVVAFTARKVS